MRQMSRVVMAAVLVVLLSWGSVARGFAQEGAGRPFITKWQGKAGKELRIPIVGTDYKLVIKDEQGKVVTSKEKVTVTGKGESYYPAFTPTADGVYTVEAGPEGVRYMRMEAEWNEGKYILLTSNAQLLEVVQFGTIAWESMEDMFFVCENMTFAANIAPPDLTQVTNMEGMFVNCRAFNQPLEKWDMSKVTNMRGMFVNCSAFNQPLEKWTVSQVTNMEGMFWGCRAFDQPLEKWNVSKVTNMSEMFSGCSAFNQPLGTWKLWTAIGSLSTTAMSAINYSLSLIGWARQTDGASNLQFGENVKGLVYNDAGREAREKLIARGWTFEGDVYKPSGKVAISLVKEGEGTLAVEGYNDAALQAVAEGTELTVTATPNDGYTLTSLTAGTQDIFATKKFTVTGAVTVKAVFKKKTVAITLAKEGEGTLAIEGYNDAALQAVAEGTELTVIATPKDGYTLTSLTAGTQDILATKKFTVTGAVTVKAVFKKKENNGGGNGGGGWQPQTPQAVEDVVLASLVVAPNPFTSQLRIENPEGIAARYELVNVAGVVVRTGAFVATEVFVDTETLPTGVYFVRITGQNGAKRVEKVVK